MNERMKQQQEQEIDAVIDALNGEMAKDFPEVKETLKHVKPAPTIDWQREAERGKAETAARLKAENPPSGLNIKPGSDDVPPPPGRLELIDKLLAYVARNNGKIEQLEAANVKALAEAERLLAAVRGAL